MNLWSDNMINIAISTNFLIAISIFIFILIVGCIAFIIYKDKKSDREEIDEILSSLVEAKPREVVATKVPSTEEKAPEENKLNLENMLEQMQKDLEGSKEEIVSNFENEQEEKAIISYQELIKNTKKEEYKKEIEKHEEIEELTAEKLINEKEFVDQIVDSKEDIVKNKNNKKFKNTEFISPVYGKMEENLEYPTVKLFSKEEFKHAKKVKEENIEYDLYEKNNNHLLEETLNIKPISDEIKKNDEFLKALKEFRGNL